MENDLFAMRPSLGRVILNAVIAGGPDAAETLHSAQAPAGAHDEAGTTNADLAEGHLGSMDLNRQPIAELELFRIHPARILGWVTLPHYTAQTFGQDVEQMLKRRWTFQEAHERLRKVKEALWVRLDRVFATAR